jgi:hypothetical protein
VLDGVVDLVFFQFFARNMLCQNAFSWLLRNLSS